MHDVKRKENTFMYDPIIVADYIIDKMPGKVTPLQLQKLIYFAHGWHLALGNRPLISSEIMVWKYGPVIQSIYHEFKKFGKDPITEKSSPGTQFFTPSYEKGVDDPWSAGLIDRVVEIYGKADGITLSKITHASDGPWSKEKNNGKTIISNDVIKEYFSSLNKK